MLNIKDEHSNLYDIEFLGLLKEINKRIDNFPNDTLKIQSWIKCFMLPVETLKGKKKQEFICNQINQ